MRFKYIVPVYVADANKRPPGYVPGVYEVSETTGFGVYRTSLMMFQNALTLRIYLETKAGDFARLGVTLEQVQFTALKQIKELDLNLQSAAQMGHFNPHQFPRITQRQFPLNIPETPYPFKHRSEKFRFKHSLYRVYGVRIENVVVVTGCVLKTTNEMERIELEKAQQLYDYLGQQDFDLKLFQNTYFPL